ncbi:MAG: RNA-binding cell elongation regulator Jag/EloR [Candidatus Nitrospinota bacterium M3_3B_026]
MDWVEIEKATKEEAEAEAMRLLGVESLDGLEIQEMKVTRKFLGMGGKTYKIRARLKESAQEPEEAAMEHYGQGEEIEQEEYTPEPEEEAAEAPEEAPERPAAPETPPDEVVTMDSKFRPWVNEGPAGVVIPRKGRGYGRRLYNPEPFTEEEAAAPKVMEKRAPARPREEEEEEREEEFVPPVFEDAEDSPVSEETRRKAVEFIQQILEDMGIDGETRGYRLADRLMIQIKSDSGGLLIGRKGETLEAMQYLLDIIINRQLEHRVRVVLDAENYREKRKLAVFQKAKRAADDAVRTRRPYPLAPMNPAERRLVHLALADDPRVETRSEGEGARRRVVIHPSGAASRGKPPARRGKGFKPRRGGGGRR